MRDDMAKVIVERPRIRSHWNKAKGYQRQLRRMLADGPPIREGMKRLWKGGTKMLNEHLGPLRRYLDSQVGRPWDKVYSEICAHISRNSAVQDHVRDHVEQYVTVNVVLIDGVPCSGGGDWHGYYGYPLSATHWRLWYVCPRSGLLKRVKRVGKAKRRPTKKAICFPRIRISDTLQCRYLDGAWHVVTFKPLPACRDQLDHVDVILNRPICNIDDATVREHHGALVYATDKRRLAKRELRSYPIPMEQW